MHDLGGRLFVSVESTRVFDGGHIYRDPVRELIDDGGTGSSVALERRALGR